MKFRDFKNDRYFQEYLRKKEEEKRLTEEKRKRRIIQQNRERQMRYQLWLRQQQLSQIGEFASTSVSTPDVSIPIVTDGLIFHIDAGDVDSYPGSGTTVSDLIGSNDGALNNGTTFTSDNGGSFILDGIDDYISVPDSDIFTFGNNVDDSPFSIESWIKPVNGTPYRIISKFDNTTREWFLSTNDFDGTGTGNPYFVIYSFNSNFIFEYIRTDIPITNNQWHNITATYDGRGGSGARNGMKLYVDGEIQSVSGVASGTYQAMGNKPTNLDIGRLGTGYAAGSVAVAKLYDKELSASEVLQNYNALSSRYV